jgi:uncharacterized membrane protein
MTKSIQEYLNELRDALAGSDPAVVQDAISDAEEHLSNALNLYLQDNPDVSKAGALSEIIDKYGTPEEVASSYREIEIRTPPAFAYTPITSEKRRFFMARFFGIYTDASAWGALFYMLFFSLASGIVYFTWTVTGISLTAGFLVLIIGLPFFALFLITIRGIALVEGRVVEALLGIRMPRRPVFSGTSTGWWARFKNLVSDKYTWLSIAYFILKLPLGIVDFVVFVTLLAVSLALIAVPVVQYVFNTPFIYINGVSYEMTTGWVILAVVVGILLLTATMHLTKVFGRMNGALAKSLLVRS